MIHYFLMRHAHAKEGERMDAERGLTPKGKRQAKLMAKLLDQLGVKLDCVASSHFVRAVETAEFFHATHRLQDSRLEPDRSPEEAWSAIATTAPDETGNVLIVTHHPLIQPILGSAVFAHSAEPLFNEFDHANICHFDSDGTFHWFMTPKLAKKLLANPETKIAEAGLELAESLRTASRRRILGPLEKRLTRIIAARFKAQAKAYPDLWLDDEDEGAWRKIRYEAYYFGADVAAGQLGTLVSEAKQKRARDTGKLPGYDRSFEDIANELDDTSAERIEAIQQKGAEDGMTAAAIALLVRKEMRSWADTRAPMAAEYETSKAFHQGMKDTAKADGRQIEKSWDPGADACEEICQPNADMGAIPEEAPFDSGDFEPPAHPRCDCGLEYSVVEE